jgi:ABC-2 type transport system ATP-binding protein
MHEGGMRPIPMENNEIAIEVENLVVKYNEFVAVNGVTFTVKRGEVLGLLGPNGAGKTSIIRALTTLNGKCQGILRINGFDVLKQPSKVRRTIGLVSQQNSLDVFLNTYDGLYLYAWLQGVPRTLRKRKVLLLLDAFGLSEKKTKSVTALSGGQYRRLQLARIFLSDAPIFFLDEPSVGLDFQAKQSFWGYLRNRSHEAGNTIVLATNDLTEAEQMCDRIIFVKEGMIAAEGTVDALTSVLNKTMIDIEFSRAPSWNDDSWIKNSKITAQTGNSIQVLYHKNGEPFSTFIGEIEEKIGSIRSLTMRQPNLYDVFLDLMEKK